MRTLTGPWSRWRAVADHGTGTYINFQGVATAEDLATAYPPCTNARLAAVKRTYDPENRFALSDNIKPPPPKGPILTTRYNAA